MQFFRTELDKELAKIDLNNTELAEFHNEFLSVLNKHAPMKYKYIRVNSSSYITKSLRKEFIPRSRLSFLRQKQENLCNYIISNEIFV